FHGPLALVESSYSALIVDVGGRSTEAAREIWAAVRERGGDPVLLRAADDTPVLETTRGLMLQAPVDEPYAPIVALVLGQLLAVEVALARGLDPAHPRGLR